MAQDILGPADASNSVTTRPGDLRTFGVNDTWFKDCTDPDVDDGTEMRADYLNGHLANARQIARVNGLMTDGVTPVVPEVGGDDYLMVKAIQHLIQRGRVVYADDIGSVNAFAITLAPVLREYKAGLAIRVKVSNTITAAPNISVNGLAAKAVIHMDGSLPVRGELRSGMILDMVYDGTSFQLVSFAYALPVPLTAPLDIYVNGAIGNDSFDGLSNSAGHPFATIQRAVNVAASYNLNGFNITIRAADYANYQNVTLSRFVGNGSKIIIIGNVVTPANCYLNCTYGTAFSYGGSLPVSGYEVSGFKVSSGGVNPTTGELSCGFYGVGAGSSISIRNIEFGAVAGDHMAVDTGASLSIRGSGTGDAGSFIRVTGSCGGNHMRAAYGSNIYIGTPNLVVPSSITVGGAWASAYSVGVIFGVYGTQTVSVVPVGQKYNVSTNGVINTSGSGANYFPGTVAGAASTGGQYV